MSKIGKLSIEARGTREIVVTRGFDAPRALVFEAWTKPELLKRWLQGRDDWPLVGCEIDLRIGGRLRFEWHNPDGRRMAMSGVYREVTPPERLVHTEIFDEDWTGGETLVTLELSENAGVTTAIMTVLYTSAEARDGALKSPMAEGMEESYVRLDAMLADPVEG